MYENADQLFEQLETISVDPYLQRVIEEAREFEDFLNTPDDDPDSELTQITKKDLEKEKIDKMDAECPHIGTKVLVTGTVLRAYYDELEEKYLTTPVEYEEELVTSMGYSTLAMDVGGDEKKIVVGHIFLLESGQAFREEPGLVDFIPRLYGFAPVGSVEIGYEAADVDNTLLLQRHVPELLEEIDGIVGNAENECDALMKLGSMTISPELDIPHEVLSALLLYVHNRLDFDQSVPYEVAIQGMFYDADKSLDDELILKYFRDVAGVVIAYPTSLTLMPYPTIKDKKIHTTRELHWQIDLRTMAVDPKEKDINFTVPVRNIRSMNSIRRAINGR